MRLGFDVAVFGAGKMKRYGDEWPLCGETAAGW